MKGHGLLQADQTPSKFLKAVFHKFYLVYSWIPWPIWYAHLARSFYLSLFYRRLLTIFCQFFWSIIKEIDKERNQSQIIGYECSIKVRFWKHYSADFYCCYTLQKLIKRISPFTKFSKESHDLFQYINPFLHIFFRNINSPHLSIYLPFYLKKTMNWSG